MPRKQILEDYAKWTAFSATRSGSPLKSRGDVYPLIEAINFGAILTLGRGPIGEEEFSQWHRVNAAALHERRSEMPIGWTTKLININLKTMVYVAGEGRPGLVDLIHPPIDNGLWDGILQQYGGNRRDIIEQACAVRRIRDIATYDTYGTIIAGCRLVAADLGCRLIEVEQLWLGTAY